MPNPPTLPELMDERDTSKNIRLTISVTPEVHAAFQRLAKASGRSLGSAMGEWMADTLDAVEFMATTMEEARAAPKLVAQRLHSYALGLTDMTGDVLKDISERSRGAPAERGAARPAEEDPRLVIRGGKSPGKTPSKRKGPGTK